MRLLIIFALLTSVSAQSSFKGNISLKGNVNIQSSVAVGAPLTYSARTDQCELGTEPNCPSAQPLAYLACNTWTGSPATYTPTNTTAAGCFEVNGGTAPNIGSLTGAGTIIVSPDFGSNYLRVTGYETSSLSPGCPGVSYVNGSEGATSFWGADATWVFINPASGSGCVFAFAHDTVTCSGLGYCSIPSSISGQTSSGCTTNCTQFINGSTQIADPGNANMIFEVDQNSGTLYQDTLSACSPSIGTCSSNVARTYANAANWVFARAKVFDPLTDCSGRCGLPSGFTPNYVGVVAASSDGMVVSYDLSDDGQNRPLFSDSSTNCPQPSATTVTHYGPSFLFAYSFSTSGWRTYNTCGFQGVDGGVAFIHGSYGGTGIPTDGSCSTGCAPDGQQPIGTSGGSPLPDQFYLHDTNTTPNPLYTSVGINESQSGSGSCSGSLCLGQPYIWEIATTNVRPNTLISSQGHNMKGYECGYYGKFYTAHCWHAPNSATAPNLLTLLSVARPTDDHGTYNYVNTMDYQPPGAGTANVCDQTGTPGATPGSDACPPYYGSGASAPLAWWSEIIASENVIGNYTNSVNLFGKHCNYGSGANTAACVYRFGANYSTGTNWNFSGQNAIANIDPTGHFALFTSDWNITLGCTNGQSSGCVDPISAGNAATSAAITNVAVDGAGTVATITATNTSPVISTGMYVKFASLTGATFLNSNSYFVSSFNSTTFSVCAVSAGAAGVCTVNGIGHASYSASDSGGTAAWAGCGSALQESACQRTDDFVIDLLSAN
jgi:hypothetical protein